MPNVDININFEEEKNYKNMLPNILPKQIKKYTIDKTYNPN